MTSLSIKSPITLPQNRLKNFTAHLNALIKSSNKKIGHQLLTDSIKSALSIKPYKSIPHDYKFPFDISADRTHSFISKLVLELSTKNINFPTGKLEHLIAITLAYPDYQSLCCHLELYVTLTKGDWSYAGVNIKRPREVLKAVKNDNWHPQKFLSAGSKTNRYGDTAPYNRKSIYKEKETNLYYISTDSQNTFPLNYRQWSESLLDLLLWHCAKEIFRLGPAAWNGYLNAQHAEGPIMQRRLARSEEKIYEWEDSDTLEAIKIEIKNRYQYIKL